jgi:opacity protein-like surface antigen
MKLIYRISAITILFLVCAAGLQAQEKMQMKIGYNLSIPAGASFKDAVSKPSFRGIAGEITYPVNERIRVGLGASFNDYYQKYDRAVYNTGEGQISAVVTNSIQTTPILARVNYDLGKKGMLQPYVGLGAGINWVMYSQYLGEFPNSKSMIKPAVSGSAGVNVPFGKSSLAGFNLGASFNYLPFHYNEIKTLNNWGVHAGVYFPLR